MLSASEKLAAVLRDRDLDIPDYLFIQLGANDITYDNISLFEEAYFGLVDDLIRFNQEMGIVLLTITW